MQTVEYRLLFKVSLRHAFYSEGISRDFVVVPAPACRAALDRYGLRFRPDDDGGGVLARTDPEAAVAPGSPPDASPPNGSPPDGSPPAEAAPVLFTSLGDEVPVFRFVLRLANRFVLNVSEVAARELGRRVFYFDNLRDDADGPARYLGDSVAGARVAEPIRFVTRPAYTHAFATPVNGATLVLKDLFGHEKHTFPVVLEKPGQPLAAYTVDLDAVEKMGPGRYLMEDDHGTATAFYYDPALFGHDVFGVIDLYNSTAAFTSDPARQVPDGFAFLDGDRLLETPYTIRFEARRTLWQYVVVRQHNQDLDLSQLNIAGVVVFDQSTANGWVTFTSQAEVPFSDVVQELVLQSGQGPASKPVRTLPNPGMKHVLQKGETAGRFLSKIYIYV